MLSLGTNFNTVTKDPHFLDCPMVDINNPCHWFTVLVVWVLVVLCLVYVVLLVLQLLWSGHRGVRIHIVSTC